MSGSRRTLPGTALLAALLTLCAPAGAQETLDELAAACSAGGGDRLRDWCREVAYGFRAAQGGVGLSAAGGAALPGLASTLGRRLGSTPRFSFGARLGGARPVLPEFAAEAAPAPGRRSVLPAVQLAAGAGLFDGFAPVPTVGGVLALDVVGTAGASVLPRDRGFGGSAASYGLGARLGLLRESFTLPGVTVSAAHRWTGDVALGGEGTAGEAVFDLSTTSLRGLVGKDLMAVGVVLGAGWDRYASDVSLRATAGETGREGTASAEGLVSSRPLVFGGAALNYLVLQVSAEVGWAAGFGTVPERPEGGFDPAAGTWFGGLALRLLY